MKRAGSNPSPQDPRDRVLKQILSITSPKIRVFWLRDPKQTRIFGTSSNSFHFCLREPCVIHGSWFCGIATALHCVPDPVQERLRSTDPRVSAVDGDFVVSRVLHVVRETPELALGQLRVRERQGGTHRHPGGHDDQDNGGLPSAAQHLAEKAQNRDEISTTISPF